LLVTRKFVLFVFFVLFVVQELVLSEYSVVNAFGTSQ
jgi:hypothetical protein